MRRPSSPILLLMLFAILLTGPTAMARGPAPEGRTYFTYLIGLNDERYEASAVCLAFDATQACSLDEEFCLDWQRTEGGLQNHKESSFSMAAEIDDEGLIITFEGQGRVNSRGKRSSISLSGRAAALNAQVNFAFAGRQVGSSRCLQMLEDFYDAQTAAR